MLTTMDVACLQQGKCIPSSFRSSTHRPRPILVLSRVNSVLVHNKRRTTASSYRFKSMGSASNFDTLVSGSIREDKKLKEVVGSKKQDEEEQHGDLKSWMHQNGLPPCKISLKERPSHDAKHCPIHYIAASEDLQVYFWTNNYLFAVELFAYYFISWFSSDPFSFFLFSDIVDRGRCLFRSKSVSGDTGESFGKRDCGWGFTLLL